MSNHAQGWKQINAKPRFSWTRLHPMVIVTIMFALVCAAMLFGGYISNGILWVLAQKSALLTISMVSIASIVILRLVLNMSWRMTIAIGILLSIGAITVPV